MTKTLAIGLDAACWEYLDPVIARGEMPALEGLMRAGIAGLMGSTLPAHTPTAWGSVITGKNPGKHGVFDHIVRRPDSYDFVPTSSRHRRGTPFWERLNAHGLRVGLVNVPFAHPPDPVDGFVICGFGSPESSKQLAYPDDILSRIEAKFGSYRPTVAPEVLRADPMTIFQAERQHQEQLVRMATHLAAEEQVDVLVMNLMLLDHANHRMPSMDLVDRAMAATDADLRWVLDQFSPDQVVLFSDHGSRRTRGVFLLDAWLRDRGYAVQEPRSMPEKLAAVNWILMQRERAVRGGDGSQRRALRWVARQMLARFPERLLSPVWGTIEEQVPFARDHVRFRPNVDHAQSAVYFGGTFSGLLYFNRVGREPNGLYTTDEAEQLATELSRALLEIPDPGESRPLFAGVHRPKDLYQGPAVYLSPDLILDTYEATCNVATNFGRGAKATTRTTQYFLEDAVEFGHHSKMGMFVFVGGAFGRGEAQHVPSVTDLAPLLLSLYDVPLPTDFDGRLPTELMSAEFLAGHAPSLQEGDAPDGAEVSEAYSSQEAEEVLEHLKALGYLG